MSEIVMQDNVQNLEVVVEVISRGLKKTKLEI
jgi:hypothetical protein